MKTQLKFIVNDGLIMLNNIGSNGEILGTVKFDTREDFLRALCNNNDLNEYLNTNINNIYDEIYSFLTFMCQGSITAATNVFVDNLKHYAEVTPDFDLENNELPYSPVIDKMFDHLRLFVKYYEIMLTIHSTEVECSEFMQYTVDFIKENFVKADETDGKFFILDSNANVYSNMLLRAVLDEQDQKEFDKNTVESWYYEDYEHAFYYTKACIKLLVNFGEELKEAEEIDEA